MNRRQVVQARRTRSIRDRVSGIVNVGFAISSFSRFRFFFIFFIFYFENFRNRPPRIFRSIRQVILRTADRFFKFLENAFAAVFFSHFWIRQIPNWNVRFCHVHVFVQTIRRAHHPFYFNLKSVNLNWPIFVFGALLTLHFSESSNSKRKTNVRRQKRVKNLFSYFSEFCVFASAIDRHLKSYVRVFVKQTRNSDERAFVDWRNIFFAFVDRARQV